ncbi:HtaA domain-containing protein [bacterium RCC_150]
MANERHEVPQGGLKWNIKERFREYVRSLPDGAETWTGDAGRMEPEALVFDFDGAETDGAGGRILRFKGSVRFQGYRGALRVDIADPWVEETVGGMVITADIAPPGTGPRRVPLATLPAAAPAGHDDRGDFIQAATQLTEEGSALLGSVYPPGSEADPVTYHVTGLPLG